MFLSKEIVMKIRDAEAQAERIKSDADREAAERVRRARESGERLCEKRENDAEQKNKERLKLTEEKANELLGSARVGAESEAEELRQSAEFNMREAVRFIILGVNEQCQ